MNNLATISKLQSAKLAVREVKELDEIKLIIDQAEALRNYARAQRLSREIQDDVAEYALYATRQMGIISAGIEKATVNPHTSEVRCPDGGHRKIDTLAAAGIDRRRANEAEKLAAIPDKQFAEIIAEKKESGELTKTAVMEAITKPEVIAKPHIVHNSGNYEWYTPIEYIDAARKVMGGIDLDPASCEFANRIVRANAYYTVETDGLAQPWNGRVWLNPPYAGELISRFCDKLKYHVERGDIEQAIVLVNNATETAWFNTLISASTAFVFPRARVKFYTSDGKAGTPLQGQAVTYIGSGQDVFMDVFSPFGWGAFT